MYLRKDLMVMYDNKKKPLIMRIIVLALVAALVLGLVVGTVLYAV